MRFLALAIVAVWTNHASAAPDDPRASAKQLFDEGRALAKAGKYDAACDRFERSFKLDAETGTEVNLADCFEHTGKLLRAWTLFDDAANTSDRAGNSVRAKFARDRANLIVGKLGTVVLRVTEPKPAGLKVTIDGAERTLDGELRERVEPHDIVVVATAPDRVRFETTMKATAGATIEIVVPTLAPIDSKSPPRPPVPTPPTPTPAPAPALHRPEPLTTTRRSPSRVRAAAILGAASVVAGASGLVVVLVAKGNYDSDVKSHDVAAANRQVRNADIATGLGIGAAALAVTAAIVYVTAPRERVVIAPVASPGAIGAALAVRF